MHAKRIALEDKARAFIMLQESEQLELSRNSRLVGNFASEKELFLMMGKFTGQLKELPGAVDMHAPSPLTDRPSIAAPKAEETEARINEVLEPLHSLMLNMQLAATPRHVRIHFECEGTHKQQRRILKCLKDSGAFESVAALGPVQTE